jgi:hypothetical protein
VSLTVDAGGLTSPPDAPTGTARADEPVTDTAQAIATYVAVIGSQTDGNDPASMEHEPKCRTVGCGHPRGWHRHGAGSCLECGCTQFGFVSGIDPSQAERERLARLKRWQAER